MKIKIFNVPLTAVALVLVTLSGCASVKPHKATHGEGKHDNDNMTSTNPRGTYDEKSKAGLAPGIALKIDSSGRVTLISEKDGLPLEECGKKCGIFVTPAVIDSVNDLHITAINYKVPKNPNKDLKGITKGYNSIPDGICSVIIFRGASTKKVQDPRDPDCPAYQGPQ